MNEEAFCPFLQKEFVIVGGKGQFVCEESNASCGYARMCYYKGRQVHTANWKTCETFKNKKAQGEIK